MNELSKLCENLRNCSGHKEKSGVLSEFINEKYDGDLHLLFSSLLPKETRRVYGLKDKQLLNLFGELFELDKETLIQDAVNTEDAATTIGKFFKQNNAVKPSSKSSLTLEEVDEFLERLTSKEMDRLKLLKGIVKRCTVSDLITLVRLIRQDLRINAGAKQILDGLHPQAYSIFQASRDLKIVIEKVSGSPTGLSVKRPKLLSRTLSTGIHLMTPIKPMLAQACRSAAQALAKANEHEGLLVEIKYDGERVQVHKRGDEFRFFSRSLKPVQSNKVADVEQFIPQAFKDVNELVIDSEVLLLDTTNNKPLPFGTLNIHKRAAFKSASVCLFVFDCLFLNGQSLIGRPISERRRLLEQSMCEVPQRVLFSERHTIKNIPELNILMARVFADGLEGLVLKPYDSLYEPGKRHWLKIKRDYLGEGSMADSVDLVVLGAYNGTGNKAGLMSVFLMGAYDPNSKQFVTVTKCGNGFSDEMLQNLQSELQVKPCKKANIPPWLNVSKSLVPDFVVLNPKEAPVWEITGAEFSRTNTHTAGLGPGRTDGISIRFPRFTKNREDKSWKDATDVNQLERLFTDSGQRSNWLELLTQCSSPTKPGVKRSAAETSSCRTYKQTKLSHLGPQVSRGRRANHLNSTLENMVLKLADEMVDDTRIFKLLRKVLACGGHLSGSVHRTFGDFVTDENPTHLLVPQNYVKPSDVNSALTLLTVEALENTISMYPSNIC